MIKSLGKLRIIMWAVVFVIGIGLIGMAEAQFYMGEQGWGQGWAPFSQYGMQGYYPAWGGLQYPAAAPYQRYQAFGGGDYGGYNPAYQWTPTGYDGGYYGRSAYNAYPAMISQFNSIDEYEFMGIEIVEMTPHSWEQLYYSGHGGYGGYSHTPPDESQICTSGYRFFDNEIITHRGEDETEVWLNWLYENGAIPSPTIPARNEE